MRRGSQEVYDVQGPPLNPSDSERLHDMTVMLTCLNLLLLLLRVCK